MIRTLTFSNGESVELLQENDDFAIAVYYWDVSERVSVQYREGDVADDLWTSAETLPRWVDIA